MISRIMSDALHFRYVVSSKETVALTSNIPKYCKIYPPSQRPLSFSKRIEVLKWDQKNQKNPLNSYRVLHISTMEKKIKNEKQNLYKWI